MLRIDEFATLRGVLFRDQLRDRNLREVGVGIVFGAIGPGHLFRFDHGVQGFRRIAARRAQIESFKNVEDL